MTLVFDRRQELGGEPAVHALIVGVSEYSHLPADNQARDPRTFDLGRLKSPALSAWTICRWLIANRTSLPRELATVRVLLSPSALETPKLEPLSDDAGIIAANPAAASWLEFVAEAKAWREDARRHRDGMTFFYYCGHGLERFGAPLLTLSDFVDPGAGGLLQRSFELNANFVAGMAPTDEGPDIARTQFYFIDSCREQITDATGLRAAPGSIWEVVPLRDDRATPVFMATFSGARAQALGGRPSDFAQALIAAFETGSEASDLSTQRWPVTSFTLDNALSSHFRRAGTGQYSAATGMAFKNVTLRWLDTPPPVEFSLLIKPDAAVEFTTVSLKRVGGGFERHFEAARPDHPYRVSAQAGIFELSANGGDKYGENRAFEHINQQRPVWPVSMRDVTQ